MHGHTTSPDQLLLITKIDCGIYFIRSMNKIKSEIGVTTMTAILDLILFIISLSEQGFKKEITQNTILLKTIVLQFIGQFSDFGLLLFSITRHDSFNFNQG